MKPQKKPSTKSSHLFDFFEDTKPFEWVKQKVSSGNYTVFEIPADEAVEIVKKYHYSGKAVPNSSLHLGIMGEDGKLKGCLSFGTSMNPSTPSKFSDVQGCMELNRMVMTDDEPRNSESRAISLCIKWLKKYKSDVKWLLSFSDGKEGNVGYIYQATNWKYLGYLLSDSFYDLDGLIMHNVSVWHKYKEKHPDRDTKTTDEILCDNFASVSKLISKQHVYVMPLHHKVSFLQEYQKYPKVDIEVPVLKRIIIKAHGNVLTKRETICYTDEELNGL